MKRLWLGNSSFRRFLSFSSFIKIIELTYLIYSNLVFLLSLYYYFLEDLANKVDLQLLSINKAKPNYHLKKAHFSQQE